MIKFSATLGDADCSERTGDDGRYPYSGNHRPAQQYDGLRLLQRYPTEKFGLVRTASLINAARNEVKIACWSTTVI